MSVFAQTLTTIVLAIIGVAIVALIVSRKSNTTGVIQAGASALGNNLGVAMSPVTGANYRIDLSYPDDTGMFTSLTMFDRPF